MVRSSVVSVAVFVGCSNDIVVRIVVYVMLML